MISANLQRSGLFRPLDPASFIEKDLNAAVQPRFPDWKQINAQALVNGTVTVEGGRLKVDFRLWDVFAEQQLLGLQFTSSPENWRRVAHKISDAVYERLTGEKGYFDTRVVFVAESGGRGAKTKRLAIMDQDGANPSYLTNGATTIMTPRFSSTSQEITYMALRPQVSAVYLFNLETGRRESADAVAQTGRRLGPCIVVAVPGSTTGYETTADCGDVTVRVYVDTTGNVTLLTTVAEVKKMFRVTLRE